MIEGIKWATIGSPHRKNSPPSLPHQKNSPPSLRHRKNSPLSLPHRKKSPPSLSHRKNSPPGEPGWAVLPEILISTNVYWLESMYSTVHLQCTENYWGRLCIETSVDSITISISHLFSYHFPTPCSMAKNLIFHNIFSWIYIPVVTNFTNVSFR